MNDGTKTTCYTLQCFPARSVEEFEVHLGRLHSEIILLLAFNLRSVLFLSFYLESNQLRTQRIPGVYVLPAAKSPLSMYFVILAMDE